MIIVRALGSRSWEVERLRSDGTRTGELLKKTSYQLKKPQQGGEQGFPAANSSRSGSSSTNNNRSIPPQQQQRGGEQQQEQQQDEIVVQEASDGNDEVEVVANTGGIQEQDHPQEQVQQEQQGEEVLVNVSEESNEQVEVVRQSNNNEQQEQAATQQPNQPPPTTTLQRAAAQISQALMRENSSSSLTSASTCDPVQIEESKEEEGDQNNAPPQIPPGSIRVADDDVSSEVSLDDYFVGMEDFPFFVADEEDAIDPNSAALAREIESRDVYRVKHQRYVARKKQLVDENWTINIEAPKRNGIEIGDLVFDRHNRARLGIVVSKHPDSIPGNPFWKVQFYGENDVVERLAGGNQIRLIHDHRTFSWRIVDGDSKPNDPVEEFNEVGVIGFDFQKSFSTANLSINNQNYDFPFLRLLMHLWPGKCLIAEWWCVTDCIVVCCVLVD